MFKKNAKLALFVAAFWFPTIACGKIDASSDDAPSLNVSDVSSIETIENWEESLDLPSESTTENARRGIKNNNSTREATTRDMSESTKNDSETESTTPYDTTHATESQKYPPTTVMTDSEANDSSELSTVSPIVEQPISPPDTTETEPVAESPTQPTVIQPTEPPAEQPTNSPPTEPPVVSTTEPKPSVEVTTEPSTEPPIETTTEPTTEPSSGQTTALDDPTAESQSEETTEETTVVAMGVKEYAEAYVDEIAAYAAEYGWSVAETRVLMNGSPRFYYIYLRLAIQLVPDGPFETRSMMIGAAQSATGIATSIYKKPDDVNDEYSRSSYDTWVWPSKLYDELAAYGKSSF